MGLRGSFVEAMRDEATNANYLYRCNCYDFMILVFRVSASSDLQEGLLEFFFFSR
jgi:hypothetical protein